MKRFRAAAAFALLLSSAACDLTGSDSEDAGTLSFSYTGAESGTYEVRGERRGGPGWHSYAAAGVFFDSFMRVEAWDGGSVADLFLFVGAPTRPGTYSFTLPGSGGFYGALLLDVDRRSGSTRRNYDLASGTLVLEEGTAERVRGRFSGTAVDPADPTRVVTITDGHFDVPNNLDPPIID